MMLAKQRQFKNSKCVCWLFGSVVRLFMRSGIFRENRYGSKKIQNEEEEIEKEKMERMVTKTKKKKKKFIILCKC